MRILVLGGTMFAGRRTVHELKTHGHEVAVLHRGEHEPRDLAYVLHFHGDRDDLPTLRPEIDAFAPDLI